MNDLLRKSIGAGMAISLGGMVYLKCTNKLLGAFLFSLGLLCVLFFKLKLFTGVTGHVKAKWDPEGVPFRSVLLILLGNGIGCLLMGLLGCYASFRELAVKVIALRGDRILHSFQWSMAGTTLLLAVICGILMYVGVDGFKRAESQIAGVPVAMLAVVLFIICGAEHVVADFFYVFCMGLDRFTPEIAYFLLTVAVGNLIGGQIANYFLREKSAAE